MIALICGGVSSGKSEIAESLAVAVNKGKLAYLATLSPHDDECGKRIERHRQMRRGKGFETFEFPHNIEAYLDQLLPYETVLLECMSTLIANEMFIGGRNPHETIKAVAADIRRLSQTVKNVIIVSSTVFTDFKGYDQFTQNYIEVIGKINCDIAAFADVVIESVCSVPVIHKGKREISQYEDLF
ncbi:MAG: adenosylcobinamide kinase [Peptococcaceae bacterium]|nr:adenosylcobinamide kinase [Peptococcaceae bacterium]